MSSLEDRLAALSPEKRRLLEMLRQEKRAAAEPKRPEPRRQHVVEPFSMVSEKDRARLPDGLEDAYPLTMVQLGMIFHMEATPDQDVPAYHNVNSFHLKLGYDAAALDRAAQAVVARHTQLRTSFDLSSYSEPMQLVYRQARLPIYEVDLRHLDADAQSIALERFLNEENRNVFDLRDVPLLRFHIHRRTEETFQFTLTEPHAISDGWSITSTLTEIFEYYVALLHGETPPVVEPIKAFYREFVHLEREALNSEECKKYWQHHLAGCTVSRLPRWPATQSTAPVASDHKPTILIDSQVTAGLHRLTQSASVSLKTVLLAAHLKVMSLLAGEREIITGLTTHGRPEKEDGERIRGLFLNTLPFRFLVRPGSWDALVRSTFEAELEVMPYRRYPLAAAQKLAGKSTLFESVFSYLHFHSAEAVVRSNRMEMLPGSSDRSLTHFPLAVTFLLSAGVDGTLQLTIEHSGDFHGQQIEWIQDYFRKVLRLMAEDPAAGHERVGLLPAEELELMRLERTPDRLLEGQGDDCLHEFFAAEAQRYPGRAALACEGEVVSYGELDRRSNRLAHHLQALGVRPDTPVGLCLERTPELVVAILAVLKTGAPYVPLDPAYPEARIAFAVEDTGIQVLVTRGDDAAHLPQGAAQIVDLSDHGEAIAQRSAEPLGVRITAEHPAYILYTSGSTGKPKGVVVSHGNVIRLLAATHPWFDFDAHDVWTLFHSYAFDFSVWELWGALRYGGTLVIVPRLVSRSPEAFHGLLRDQRVTVLNQTPSAFRQLISVQRGEGAGGSLTLRFVIFGGEALEFESLRPWFDRFGDRAPRLVNMYGITETTVHVTHRPVSLRDLEQSAGSLLGNPIPDLGIYLLDPGFQPVPVATGGELCVGGAGLTQGYLARPGLTAERFVPDPWSGRPGARLYRSGDLARFLPDGDLEYLGRLDHQVKVRGFRIELGEIEAALVRHPEVQETVVVTREDVPGEIRLVGYVVPCAGHEPNVSGLRSYLLDRLPEHEVPAAFVLLETLPLTVNGKLDRAALPAPSGVRADLDIAYVAPRNYKEKVLTEIWAEALGLEKVGIHDNFLDSGGDSIRSIRVIALARERGFEVSLQQLFQHPTVEALAQVMGEDESADTGGLVTSPFSLLSEEDRAKLPEDLEDAYPLTMMQGGMLYHMQLAPETPVYHNVNSFYLQAPFEQAAFEEAVKRVIARHEVLRTSFDFSTYSEPLQLVHRSAVASVQVEDLRDLSHEEQEAAGDAQIVRETDWRFELHEAPQVRFHVQLRTDKTFQLIVTENHAILDGWSLHAMLTEIFEHMDAIREGRSGPDQTPPPPSLREFVHLERAALESEQAEEYWSQKLHGLQTTPLPYLEPPREDQAGNHIFDLDVPVSMQHSRDLHALARAAGVSDKSVLLASHLKVLSLITGHQEVVTGLITHGRPEVIGGETSYGLFLNSLPVRFRLGAETWEELVQRVFQAEQELIPLRRYPLIELQNRWSRGEPFFDTSFNLTQFHVVEEMLGSGKVASLGFKKVSETNLAMAAGFQLDAVASAVQLQLNCDVTRLTMTQIQAYAKLFLRVLETMGQEPGARHDTVCWLSPAERHQVVVEWSRSPDPSTGVERLHGMMEAQAARQPQAVAVSTEGGELSYGELDRRGNQLAHYLRRRGVSRGERVAICIERSLEMMVAALGVLKAGAAYVPLDPGYPQQRLTLMAEDAAAPVMLTLASLGKEFPGWGGEVIPLDTAWPAIASESSAKPMDAGTDDDLAYVIYTSGSTGRPKGVMVSHGAIKNRVLWMQETFSIDGGDAVLQKTPFSFDASIWEMFLPLLRGGRLVLARPDGQRDPAYMIQAVRSHRIAVLQLVPSMLQVLVEEPDFEQCDSLIHLFCGGEALSASLSERVVSRLPRVRVCNTYGPTEAAIDVTAKIYGPGNDRGLVPIGRPLPNLRIYLLDGNLMPSPLGTPGELFIGGTQLARGYLDRPALTATAFVPDSWSGEPGARLYRTGDSVHHLPSGEAMFVGRIDQQVKVRGFRIEPGEIAAALGSHPDVRQAAVVVWNRDAMAGDLVAYLEKRGEQAPSVSDLQSFLSDRLPHFMVPSFYLVLDELPRTPSGKLDYRALPEPTLAAEDGDLSAPRTPVEEIVAAIWAEVLGQKRVGVHSSFFDLGGHSLLATRVITRLREAFQIELPMVRFFDHPTVAGVAIAVEEIQRRKEMSSLPPLEVADRAQSLPLSFAQQRLWLIDRLEPESVAYNMSAFLRLKGPLATGALVRSVEAIVHRHEPLRTTFAMQGEQPIQIISPLGSQVLPQIDLGALPESLREAEMKRLALAEASQGFDLGQAVLRVRLVRLSSEEHTAFFTLHHIAGDGWSMGLLIREVIAFYDAFSEGRAAPLSGLTLQYADFAVWQRQWLQGEVLENHLDYWRRRLAGRSRAAQLPADKQPPEGREHRAGRYRQTFSATDLEGLEVLSGQHAVTLFMTLVASFDVLLAYHTGSSDVVVGTDVAGRNHVGAEGLIGFFVNQLVLHADLSGNPSFSQLLEQVRETTLGAYAHQDLPFERLVEELHHDREASRTPLFQSKLVLQTAPSSSLELPGLNVTELDLAFGSIAKFDFLLNLTSTEQGLYCDVEYSAELYEESTVARILEHFELVLKAVVADPSLPVDGLHELLREDDARRQARKQEGARKVGGRKLRSIRRKAVSATKKAPTDGEPGQ